MDVAGEDAFDLLQFAVERFVALENPLAVIVNNLALGGEPEILLAPLDEPRLELALQCANALADSGLGDLVDLGGFGEAFGFAQVAKHFQGFQLHKRSE